MIKVSLLSFFAIFAVLSIVSGKVQDLTDATFESVVDGSTNVSYMLQL